MYVVVIICNSTGIWCILVYNELLYAFSVCLPWAMAESCETPKQIKVLTLNCWAVPWGFPILSSVHLKERVPAIADFIITKQYSVIFLQVQTILAQCRCGESDEGANKCVEAWRFEPERKMKIESFRQTWTERTNSHCDSLSSCRSQKCGRILQSASPISICFLATKMSLGLPQC